MTLLETFQPLEKKHLGYGGRFYPIDMQFEIRGAGTTEIRRWSNIDENDPMSIANTTIDLLSNCVRVTSISGDNHYSHKDIYEHDKIALLLAVHSISFMDDERYLHVSGQCEGSQVSCGKQFDKLRIQPSNLQYEDVDEKYAKYFDADEGLFKIQTRDFDTINFKMSTIGVGTVMHQWMSTFTPTFIKNNQQMFKLVQSRITDWRGLTAEKLRLTQVDEYNQWPAKRLGVQTLLARDLNASLSNTLKYVCPDCGATFRTQMAIEGGYRQMFMPVQSIDDQLV